MDWSDELIALMASSSRIAKHAHVPMQSGSDAVLRRMHRKYRPWHYREKIEKIRAAMPDAAIGADVMTGFPGETDAEFAETRRMVEELPFTYLHVFTYSARPGTPAAVMPGQVSVEKARERNRILRDLAAQKKLTFMRSFVGKTVPAITLNEFDSGRTEALTDNYLKLHLMAVILLTAGLTHISRESQMECWSAHAPIESAYMPGFGLLPLVVTRSAILLYSSRDKTLRFTKSLGE